MVVGVFLWVIFNGLRLCSLISRSTARLDPREIEEIGSHSFGTFSAAAPELTQIQ